MIERRTSRLALLLALAAFAAFGVASASAAPAPGWQIVSTSNTTVAPGDQLTYFLEVNNRSDAFSSGPITLEATLPSGVTGVSYQNANPSLSFECGNSGDVSGLGTIECASSETASVDTQFPLSLTVAVDPGASGVRTAEFEVAGGGIASATTADPVTISLADPPFGIDAFDAGFGDGVGAPATQAASQPSVLSTPIDFNRHTDLSPTPSFFSGFVIGPNQPVEPARDVAVDLPAGLVGLTTELDQCTGGELASAEGATPKPLCSPESQVGLATVIVNGGGLPNTLGPWPVFNMVPPPGAPARFGFNVGGVLVSIDASLRSSGDYGITATSRNTSEGLPIAGARVEFWGVPAAEEHDAEHACSGQPAPSVEGPFCPPTVEPTTFLRSPTSCTEAGEGLPFAANVTSWAGSSDSRTVYTHQGPGYPYPEAEGPVGELTPVWGPQVGIDGCAAVPFEPALSVATTTNTADSPTGLQVDLTVPQTDDPEAIGQSDLRDAVISLPQGLSLNPSSAGGLGSCTAAQVGLLGTDFAEPNPIHFSSVSPSCPDSSKIGTLSVDTPALDHPLPGAVYLAAQGDNPFGSLLAMYLVVDDPASGIVAKLPGRVTLNESTGQVETVFDDNPQLPFSKLHLELFGGPRAALRTPQTCGTYATTGKLTPWSGNAPVDVSSSFQISQGCGGAFNPNLTAGTQNPLAGSYSPFSFRLTREDATQELGALSATLPEGLIGKPAGIPYCPDATLAAISGELGTGAAQIATPSCPAASQVGTVTVGAGSGPTPFYTSAGRIYLAGPYRGAPLSLAVVAPAVAGPFDLGSVVVRNAVHIDPTTAQLTVDSDPLPTILHGIPLDLRDVRVNVNRDHFTLNPTSCEPKSIDAALTSVQGATANRSVHFQAAACDRLGFKPKLSLKLKGGTKRSKHPALTAVLRARKGDANLGRVQVALPHSEFLAQSHIRTICTRVQFAAGSGGGAQCPKGSVYGKVTATSPLVDYPLAGNVYLRSSSHALPDMVLALHGPPTQPIQVDAVGQIDSKNGGIRTTFATVPDAPLTKVVLRLPGGQKSLIENSTNICRSVNKATVQMDGQNGKASDFGAPLKARCGGKAKRKGHKH
jgi:uncharacterized repeat protein (TIGR01451 family)